MAKNGDLRPSRPSTDENHTSSSSWRRLSNLSDYYPSWLPRRPPPPAPASSVGASPTPPPVVVHGGRKPTPRSVRIVSLQEAPRVYSRAAPAPAPAVFVSSRDQRPARHQARPRFRAKHLNLDILRNPSLLYRVYFYLWSIIIFAHIPLQTFLDFNAAFILIQVSKFPNPQAPDVPGSGRSWALAAALYIACWLAWVLFVIIAFELIYSFTRVWRTRAPPILPIYLSSSAHNLASLTSYPTFCFLRYLRLNPTSLRVALAETFSIYSQNLPTVVLLIPRASLALALLLNFADAPNVNILAEARMGVHQRDPTFFRSTDGTLTDYARGVLWANVGWAAWRTGVVLASWLGLWFLSGHAFAGLCGPRYRWEEEDYDSPYDNGFEKTRRVASRDTSSTSSSQRDTRLPWSWRNETKARVREVYEFCLTTRPPLQWAAEKPPPGANVGEEDDEEITSRVLAAVGFPRGSAPAHTKRGVLSGELFESPVSVGEEIGAGEVKGEDEVVEVKREKGDEHPYPFTAPGARASSKDNVGGVPFPGKEKGKAKEVSSSAKGSKSGSASGSPKSASVEEEDEEEESEPDSEVSPSVVSPSSATSGVEGRTSNSLSSLGHPVLPGSPSGRYPFQYRQPHGSGRGGSSSSGGAAASRATPSTLQSGVSGMTGLSGAGSYEAEAELSSGEEREGDASSSAPSRRRTTTDVSTQSSSAASGESGIPMPPRHPHIHVRERGRQRAGTVPVSGGVTTAPLVVPIVFPTVTPQSSDVEHDHDDGDANNNDGNNHHEENEDEHEDEDEDEALDRVGLLTSPPSSGASSPRTSLSARNRRNSSLSLALSLSHRSGSRSGSRSRAHSHTSSSSKVASASNAVRSRTQSLIQSVSSHSSLENMRARIERVRRNSSMARLEEDVVPVPVSPVTGVVAAESSDSRSGSGSDRAAVEAGREVDPVVAYGYSSDDRTHSRSGSESVMSSNNGGENYTFGRPIRGAVRVPGGIPSEVIEDEHRSEEEGGGGGEEVVSQQHRLSRSSSLPHSLHAQSVVVEEETGREGEATTLSTPTYTPAYTPTRPVDIPGSAIRRTFTPPTHPEPSSAALSTSSSPRDISTAAASFVTAPATITGSTTTESGGVGHRDHGSPSPSPSGGRRGWGADMVLRPEDAHVWKPV